MEYISESGIDTVENLVFENRENSVLHEEVIPGQIAFSSPIRDISHDTVHQPLSVKTLIQESTVSSASSTIATGEDNRAETSPTAPLWPVSSKEEAILLRYFSNELSILVHSEQSHTRSILRDPRVAYSPLVRLSRQGKAFLDRRNSSCSNIPCATLRHSRRICQTPQPHTKL